MARQRHTCACLVGKSWLTWGFCFWSPCFGLVWFGYIERYDTFSFSTKNLKSTALPFQVAVNRTLGEAEKGSWLRSLVGLNTELQTYCTTPQMQSNCVVFVVSSASHCLDGNHCMPWLQEGPNTTQLAVWRPYMTRFVCVACQGCTPFAVCCHFSRWCTMNAPSVRENGWPSPTFLSAAVQSSRSYRSCSNITGSVFIHACDFDNCRFPTGCSDQHCRTHSSYIEEWTIRLNTAQAYFITMNWCNADKSDYDVPRTFQKFLNDFVRPAASL